MAITHLKQEPVSFKVTHPAYGDKLIFESWIQLCEETIEIAQDTVRLAMKEEFEKKALQLCDEMIATAEEIHV